MGLKKNSEKKSFENVVCKVKAILSKVLCVIRFKASVCLDFHFFATEINVKVDRNSFFIREIITYAENDIFYNGQFILMWCWE